MDKNNPFQKPASYAPSGYTEAIDTQTRLEEVRRFTGNQLRQVIELKGVQKTVRVAAERRLRKMETGKL